jgi:phage virion morphogenesis protein
MIRLEFNAKSIFDSLDAARDVLIDLTPVHQDIGEYMVEATRERFRRGEAPDGSKWRAKSPVTLARYLANGDGARPNPLIGPSGRLSTEIVRYADKNSAEIGSALEYSGVMQRGAAQGAFGRDSRNHPIPWGNIPARVWLGISDTDERNILDIVDEHLDAALEG